ncbi:hypothetical protein [Glutamicibacter nicotianae]|uniref:Orc1-like AAA ATPase domain-containing protein n=1 Tax=Glutamicibacter nicotianae TaxID=37929 RepID=A0ABQ0RGF7_GLUNI|nr:hypothetical protein [Glutamicibacter nicotianae]GEC10883.1 hypothetical protein ANI01nite_00860 [Glutamicibacter nicotianae]
MSDLHHAHRGYVYQDLLAAVEAVDVILGRAERIWCDTRLCGEHDRFDDLTIEGLDGHRARRQIKHQVEPRELDVDTFARPARSLLLSEVLRGIKADVAANPAVAAKTSYTVYLRDSIPTDTVLTAVLVAADPDPGPSVAGTSTTRYRFNSDALWNGVHRPRAGSRPAGDAWEFLRVPAAGTGTEPKYSTGLTFTRDEIAQLCERLIVEVNAPAMSSDFAEPGPLEELLLGRLRTEVGVGEYPNENRRPEDVAASLVAAAAKARASHEPLTRVELLRVLSLRTDYGSVTRRSPAVPEQQVERDGAVESLRAAIEAAALAGGHVIAQAPPGQGKSWVADQLRSSLSNDGWTVAEHYCFLNDSEEERDDRVASERIFGSLMERVAFAHPDLASEQRPIFSADEQTLMHLVSAVARQAGHSVALIVDGLDHVTRVRGTKPGAMSASYALAAQIAALEPPSGCTVVVLSQPGEHLAPLIGAGAVTVPIPPMDVDEIGGLVGRLGLFGEAEGRAKGDAGLSEPVGGCTVVGRSPMDSFVSKGEEKSEGDVGGAVLVPAQSTASERMRLVEAIYRRSGGNPLYATYLARELMRPDRATLDMTSGSPSEVLETIPPYDGDLEHYYTYLAELLDDSGQAAADTLTLVDFPLTEEELSTIQPSQGHRISKALRVLEPVLRSSPRGFAVYHESFARFLRRELDAAPEALSARIDAVVVWMNSLGLFDDGRAFVSMLPLLAAARRYQDVLFIVDRSFAAQAVGAGFPPSAIRANLSVAIRCAQRIGDWPAVVRSLELMRGVETYEHERLADLDVRFLDVRLALFGGQQLADRMLRDGLITMPAEAGLLLCAELDRAGFAPPWRQYLHAWRDQGEGDDHRDDDAVDAALLRGQLRLQSIEGALERAAIRDRNQTGETDRTDEQSDLEQLLAIGQEWCDENPSLGRCRVVVEIVSEILGIDAAVAMVENVEAKGAFLLALAEHVEALDNDADIASYGSAVGWATQALEAGLPPGCLHRACELGAEIRPGGLSARGPNAGAAVATAIADADQQALLAAADAALEHHSLRNCELFLDALERCGTQPIALDAVIATLAGEGWYRCWLRFCVDLVRAEACTTDETSSRAMEALTRLTEDARPFKGRPRAVDLYQEMDIIWSTVARAVRLLDTDDWTGGIELLLDVGRRITRSVDGEMGVPFPPDRVLSLGFETLPDEHAEFLSEQIRREIELSSKRFYSDIAEFHLLDALVQLRRADIAAERSDAPGADVEAREATNEAKRAWSAACDSLLGYGWHKDITVFEVLDPLESLIEIDQVRGLKRLADAFDLAYGAWQHSDGRETRHAPLRCWALLAEADPVAHAENSLEHGLASRGKGTHWEEMRQDLWTSHALSADPVLAVLASATLPAAPRAAIYEEVLRRFAAEQPELGNMALLDEVLQRALTRGDEITSPSDVRESTAYEAIIASFNEMSTERGLRRLGEPVTDSARGPASRETSTSDLRPDPSLSQSSSIINPTLEREDQAAVAAALGEVDGLAKSAPAGAVGVAILTRAWRRRGVDAGRGTNRTVVVDAYADAIGARLKDILKDGRSAEVSTVLEALSEVASPYDPHMLLVRIGDAFEDAADVSSSATSVGGTAQDPPPHILREMAARAFALAWTQARNGSGWLAFGGIDHMELLSRATALAPQVTSEAVGIAIERRLNGKQTLGITRALIEALSAGALEAPAVPAEQVTLGEQQTPAKSAAMDVAFAVWDEAFAIISGRVQLTPGEKLGEYFDGVRHELSSAEPVISAQDYSLVLTTFAGLSHPGRENLRRTMIALEDLATLRPVLFAHGLAKALAFMSGAVAPVLLLTMVERVAAKDPSLLDHSTDGLKNHLKSDYLVVRVLARRLLSYLTDANLPDPISDPNVFPSEDPGPEDASQRWSMAIEAYRRAPFRPHLIDAQIQGFALAVVELIAREMHNEDFTSEWHKAARKLGGREWPDAVLLDQHVAEESLQRAAGGIRARLAANGTFISGAVEWEDGLADIIMLSPIPVMFERGRIPRPALPPPPVRIEPTEQEAASETARVVVERLGEAEPWTVSALNAGDPYSDWFVLAYCESRRANPTQSHTKPDEWSYIEAGVEADLGTIEKSEWAEPLDKTTLAQWLHPERKTERSVGRIRLAATARPVGLFVDDRARLGLPQMLAPSAVLVEALDLSGVAFDDVEMVMSDPTGPALAHVVWRASYRHSDYYMSYPRLEGAALLLRPDLVQRLKDRWGDKLTWRSWSEHE